MYKKNMLHLLRAPPPPQHFSNGLFLKKNGRFVDHPTFLLSQIDCDLLCMIFHLLWLKKLKLEIEGYFHHSFESHFQ